MNTAIGLADLAASARSLGQGGLDPLAAKADKADFVLIGEASHGTKGSGGGGIRELFSRRVLHGGEVAGCNGGFRSRARNVWRMKGSVVRNGDCWREPATMKVHEIMTPAPQVISPGDPASLAAGLMRDLDVGMIPVCDGERVVGMVTDRDIVIRLVAEGLDPSTTMVDRVMTREVLYCFHDESTEYAAAMMENHQVRRLVVLDRDKRLVGIVSLGDLATRMYAPEMVAETLEEISEPTAR